jgi:hypothetical protein
MHLIFIYYEVERMHQPTSLLDGLLAAARPVD